MNEDIMRELAKPFPDRYIHKNPSGGGSYIKHHVIEQRLIQVLGVPPSFEKVEVIFGDVAAIAPNPNGNSKRAKEGRPALKGAIVGVIARLTIVIDGRRIIVEEAGDCEQPHNWDSDGQRLKDAMSDAYKRCAMRLGCGLHLWSQDEYFLYDQLSGEARSSQPPTQTGREVSPEPSKAKSSGGATQEATKAAPVKGSKSKSTAATSSPSSSEGVKADAHVASGEVNGSTKEVESADAPSEDIYGVIANAMADKNLAMKVLIAAGKHAIERGVKTEKGIDKNNILDLEEGVLEAVAAQLNLRQGALT